MAEIPRSIAIIGAGQSGLVCAHGLLASGHRVTLYSDRTAEAFLSESRPTGVATRFGPALDYERELGLNHWEQSAPMLPGASVTLSPVRRNRALTVTARLTQPGVAIDVRLQSHRWMTDFVERGGTLEIERVSGSRLEEVAGAHDLTLVATGKGGLASLFPCDETRTKYEKPQRHLTMLCFHGPDLQFGDQPFLSAGLEVLPYAGEVFWLPFHHKDVGPSWVVSFEAKWGGPMDRFQEVGSAAEMLAVAREVTRDLMPWRSPLLELAEPSDELGWVKGAVRPLVRKPVGVLPSGQIVAALGDTAIAFDPLAAQGANNGNRMARHWVESIDAAGDQPLDAAWIERQFEVFWTDHGQHAVALTDLLMEAPPPMVAALLVAQYGSDGREGRDDGAQALADAYIGNFAEPASLTPTLLDPTRTRALIVEQAGSFLWAVARKLPGLLLAQLRQLLGRDPGHP
ncbi:MAG: oxidoreductase [Deltaproteobacteria bacterium]|nr:oxidoreductase [Deltaproteobacteria bacterium]